MKSILLLGLAREGSTRVENKMTRKIWFGHSLFSIYLKKFESLMKMEGTPFSEIVMAICPEDKELWKMASKSNVPVIQRDKNSVTGLKKISELLSFLKKYEKKYNYVMIVNGCLPFLKVETIIKAGEFFNNHPFSESMISAVKRHNWYWNDRGQIINEKDPKEMATQLTPPIYETIHTFHTAPIKRILKENVYWKMRPNDPSLFEIDDPIECLDIDTEIDFKICETLMRGGFL